MSAAPPPLRSVRRRSVLRRRAAPLASAVGLLLLGSTAVGLGQESTEIQLDEVTVTAPDGQTASSAIQPTGIVDAPVSTTVLDRNQIETLVQPARPSEFLDIMPGVATTSQGGDPGTSVNIRGLQDFGRVNVTVDGARQDFQTSGHSANGVFYIDPEMIKAVEVSRGAGSATDGSGSIGGGVAFQTIDAGDVLREGQTVGGLAKTRYTTNGAGLLGHGEAAARIGEAFDIVAAGTWSQIGNYNDGMGEEVLSSGDRLISGLVKARIRPADGHQITLSALQYHDAFDAGIATIRATTADVGTYTAGYTFADPDSRLIDLDAKAYYTTTRTDQREIEGRNIGAHRWFDIGTTGGKLQNTSRFDTGEIAHAVSYGADVYHDAVVTFDSLGLASGLTPRGDRTGYGAFAQEKMTWQWLELIGAVRYDGYQITGSGDASGQRVSPKATVAVTPIKPITLFATYAEAYRAPAITEALVAGIHPAGPSFEFLPNPNLRPEVAHEIEGGVNLRLNDVARTGDKLRAKAVGYRNVVDDYISGVYTAASPQYPTGSYQYQNIAQAKLWGAEFEGMYDAKVVFIGVAATLTRGINAKTGNPLSTIPADRVIGTIGIRPYGDTFLLGTRISAFAEQKNQPPGFPPFEAYEVVDLFASAKLSEQVTLQLNVDNLFDRYYTQFLNTYASRGRTAKVTLAGRF